MIRLLAACLLHALAGVALADDRVLEELAKRSHTPMKELNKILRDCQATTLSMNLCALRDFIAADLELQRILHAQAPCETAVLAKNEQWENARDTYCEREADELRTQGSLRPAIYSHCRQQLTVRRIKVLKEWDRCEKRPQTHRAP
jgi:uncharacterized protein YecT (DUF1311 family)